MTGYSDRINHALAFAAKHYDRQVRKGTGLPYPTHPANVAIILTRYGCDETAVVAGILHDVVADCVREGWTHEMLSDRLVEKFGAEVLDILLAIVPRKLDDDGAELDTNERREDALARLTAASPRARWVVAATALHAGSSLLADLRRTVDVNVVWSRFSAGRVAVVAWYGTLAARLRALGFDAAILTELQEVANALAHQLDGSPVI